MTKEEAIANQKEIAEHYHLYFWYATRAEKCCEVYPKLTHTNTFDEKCYLECEVCGSRNTKTYWMPWEAIEAWNNGERTEGQFKLW